MQSEMMTSDFGWVQGSADMRMVRVGRHADRCGRVIRARHDCMQFFVQNVCWKYEISQIALEGVGYIDLRCEIGCLLASDKGDIGVRVGVAVW